MAGYLTPYSATNTDTTRAEATIQKTIEAPTLNGIIEYGEIWTGISAINIDRPFENKIAGVFYPDTPTLYQAYWKACFDDTALFVLVYAEDNSFWPSWKSGKNDYESDKVEIYIGVNGPCPEGYGPAPSGVNKGLYMITHNYDTILVMGEVQAGSVPGTYEANTWMYGDHSLLITEWSIRIGGANGLKDSTGAAWDPTITPVIKFDVNVSDLDSGETTRQRQIWSNVGIHGENWNSMDSAGILELGSEFINRKYAGIDISNLCNNPVPINQHASLSFIISPTLASNYINVPIEIDNIEIIDMLGRKALIISNNSGIVDISGLTAGIYNIRLFRNKEYVGCQRIIKR